MGGEIDAPWLEDDEDSGIQLLFETMIADGTVRRVSADSAERHYQITEKGIAKVEALMETNPAAKDFYDSLPKKR